MLDRIPERWKIPVQIMFILTFIGILVSSISLLLPKKNNPTQHNLVFQVSATGGYANITLKAGSVDISRTTTVPVPWRRSIQVKSGSEVYLTAANPSQTGTLTCSISIDGKLAEEEHTDAPKDGTACALIVP